MSGKTFSLLTLAVLLVLLVVGPVSAATQITFNPSVDGWVYRAAANSTIQNISTLSGSGNDTSATSTHTKLRTATTTETGRFNEGDRSVFVFNTATIPDSSSIQSGFLNLTVNQEYTALGEFGLAVTGGSVGTDGVIVPADYQRNITTLYSDTIIQSTSFTGDTKISFPLNAAGLAAINKTGSTVFFVQMFDMTNSTFLGTWAGNSVSGITIYSNEYSTSTSRPLLSLSYIIPETTLISNIAVTNYTRAIRWTWDNSTGYSEAYVYQNNTLVQTVDNKTTGTYWVYLPPNTDYTISMYTDKNATWVNSTSKTKNFPDWPKILIMMDDGSISQFTVAYPVLKGNYSLNATSYVVTNYTLPTYMNTANMTTLYNDGWDIASHTHDHVDLTSVSESECQNQISTAQSQLDTWGFTRSSHHLSYPGGAYNDAVVSCAASQGVLTGRTVDTGTVISPYNNVLKIPKTLEPVFSTSPETINNTIDAGISGETLVIVFHEFSGTGTYSYSETNLSAVAEHIYLTGLQALTISEWYAMNLAYPPSSITSLANSTPTCSAVTFSYTKPTDADLDYVGILINGTWNNATNSTSSKALTGLPNNTVILFNSTTVDLSGNQNLTAWVNSSATTAEFCDSPSHNTTTSEKIANKVTDTQNVLFVGTYIAVIAIVASLVGTSLFGKSQ